MSVIIPVYNEGRWLQQLHSSLVNNGYPGERLELIFVDGGSTDGSVEQLKVLQARSGGVKLFFNPKRNTSRSLNLAIARARGELILRADAHAWYERHYIEHSVQRLLANPGLGGVGGRARAVGSGSFCSSCIALAVNSLSGNGGVAYRVGGHARLTDTIWCGCWRRETLQENGGFNENCVTNQDYELNFRLRAAGKPLLYDPAIRANYVCRDSLGALARQYYRYGLGRAHTLSIHPRSLRYRQLLALAPFLAILIALLSLPVLPSLSALLMAGYLLILVSVSLRAMFRGQGLAKSLGVAPSLSVMHLCWGAGFFAGVFRHIGRVFFQPLLQGRV
ncbi:MAG: glycosyltransferase family 2 protein [Gammaproteobacteria bacterium]|nr:glycosyltransferase family 2 protein [Gammaproteobacteria bacterium]